MNSDLHNDSCACPIALMWLYMKLEVERVERQKMMPLCDTGATLRSTHLCQNGS